MIKKVVVLLLACFVSLLACAQSYNADKTSWVNYLTRMYKAAPFEGVRIVIDDNDNQYLISVLALNKDKYPDESVLNKVASMKATAEASKFYNNPVDDSSIIIRTSEKPDGTVDTEVIEEIRQKSVGYVKALEHLTNFTFGESNKQVFVFGTQIGTKLKKH